MICHHANGPCPRSDAHCGFCGYPSRNGTPHPECRERGRAKFDAEVRQIIASIETEHLARVA